jgi:hypothetical protein
MRRQLERVHPGVQMPGRVMAKFMSDDKSHLRVAVGIDQC